jgi:LacI family transcriptional regulator
MARVTIDDVAAAAGVSAATVSQVYSGNRPVKPKTRVLVERVARELGYRPSAIAKSLRVQRTDTVMIVIPDITNPFYPGFARGVQDLLREHGYHTLLCNTDAEESEERAYIEEALNRRVDGVVFVPFRIPVSDLADLTAEGIAVVAIGRVPDEFKADGARFDDAAAARDATALLLDRVGPAVAHIAGPLDTPPARSRREGFLAAYADAGLEVPEGYVVATDFTQRGGIDGMRALLALPQRPRAVFCANDMVALGAIRVAREHDLSLPGDIAVMGVDDIDVAELTNPALTTIRFRTDEMGRLCGRLLLDRMSGTWDGPARNVVLLHEVVVRESA